MENSVALDRRVVNSVDMQLQRVVSRGCGQQARPSTSFVDMDDTKKEVAYSRKRLDASTGSVCIDSNRLAKGQHRAKPGRSTITAIASFFVFYPLTQHQNMTAAAAAECVPAACDGIYGTVFSPDLNTVTESLLTTVFVSEFQTAGAEHSKRVNICNGSTLYVQSANQT